MKEAKPRIQTFDQFFTYYLQEHSKPGTKLLHAGGTLAGIILFFVGLFIGSGAMMLSAPVVGYTFSWLSHAFVEHNWPATRHYPLWSFLSDFRMLYLILRGKLPL